MGFLPETSGTEGERKSVYKTAALPAELIRRTAVSVGFCGFRVNRERAKRAEEA